MPRVLVVDDEPRIVEALARLLKLEGYDVDGARDGEDALARLRSGGFEAVLLDLDMPRLDGIETLKRLRHAGDAIPVLIVSGRGTIQRAVEAVRLGAHDFIEKPVDDERLLLSLRRAIEYHRMSAEIEILREDRSRRVVVAEDPSMKELLASLARIGAAESSVLVTGETGTGKEIAAQMIHQASPRARGPFVKVNCAALPEALAESELFGHVRGAFTGAAKDRKGRFQLAHGGTLFLDEVGELSLPVQAKLLRALGEGEFEPVGSEKTLRADVRVIAATNRNLEVEIASGRFRSDLYYRLAILVVALPPLRNRSRDVEPLARHFLALFGRKTGRPGLSLGQDAVRRMETYAWPGNVRELQNCIERLAVTAAGLMIGESDLRFVLPAAFPEADVSRDGGAVSGRTIGEALDAEEARLIRAAIREARGNMTAAARIAGLERSHFYRRMKKHGIDPRES